MEQISEYIQAELKKGFTKDNIKTALMQAGYNEQQVDEAFKSVDLTPAAADRFDPRLFFHKRYVLFTIVAILIIVFGVIGMFLIADTPKNIGKETPVTSNEKKVPNAPVTPTQINPAYLDCQYSVKKTLLSCLAWTETDEKHCDELKDKNECVAFKVTKLATVSNDAAICDQLAEEEEHACKAFVQRSSSTCGSSLCIFFASARDYYEKHDTSLCGQFSGLDKGLCEAFILDKPEVCTEKLTDKDCPPKFI